MPAALLGLIGALCLVGAPAQATPNLALECFSGTPTSAVPTGCAQGWTWHTPSAGAVVITQGGSWRVFAAPPSPTDLIVLCTADVSPGAPRSACPAASIVYKLGCNAAGQRCSSPIVTPPAPIGTTLITWTNPTTYTDGSPLTVAALALYRGTKADGSDFGATPYKTLAPTLTSYTDAAQSPGTFCYGLEAADAAPTWSDLSNIDCKTITPPIRKPSAVTALTAR